MMCENSLRLSEYKVRVSHWQPCFPSESELDPNAESGGFPRNTMTIEPYILYYMCYFLVLASYICWKWLHKRKGKIVHPILALYFSPSLLISRLKVVLVESAHIKKWNKNSWVNFAHHSHCSSKNKIHMHIWAAKYKMSNFSDSTYYSYIYL